MKETVFIVRPKGVMELIVVTAKEHNKYLLKKRYPWHTVSELTSNTYLTTLNQIPYDELLVQIALGVFPNILNDSVWKHVGRLDIQLTPQDSYWWWNEQVYLPLYKLVDIWWGPWRDQK